MLLTHPVPAFNARRLTAVGAIALVHVLLVLGWQRTPAPALVQEETRSTDFVWIDLPPLPRAAPVIPHNMSPAADRPAPRRDSTAAASPSATVASRLNAMTAAVEAGISPAETPGDRADSAAPSAQVILERARRDAGTIDRALRKENNAVIVAPPDSPQLRMKQGMEEAAELAPNAVWQAPKMADLVNQTADGARRTRVVSGGGTYCVTERSPITAIETIERHGRTRITNCPQHETPARKQQWKSARD